MIPKLIHYCWFGDGQMNGLHERCVASWRKYCPDYEIKLWNESNSNLDNAYCRAAIKQKKWAFVADWVRFDALVAHGGIYLDTDLELIRPIDELLIGVDCLLARESKRSIATAFIACQAGDLTMQHARSLIADELSKRQMFATSPHILKRAVALAGAEHSRILTPKSFYPFNPYDPDIARNPRQFMYADVTAETYGVHHYGLHGSWADGRVQRLLSRALAKLAIRRKWQISFNPFPGNWN